MRLSNNATGLFYMLKYRNFFFPPKEIDFHKNAPRNEATLISPVPLASSLFLCPSISVISIWILALIPNMTLKVPVPLVCHLCHLPPLVPAGIHPVWVECEDSSICATTLCLYSQSKFDMHGPGVPLLFIHAPSNVSILLGWSGGSRTHHSHTCINERIILFLPSVSFLFDFTAKRTCGTV